MLAGCKVYLQEIRITLFASKVITDQPAGEFASKLIPDGLGW